MPAMGSAAEIKRKIRRSKSIKWSCSWFVMSRWLSWMVVVVVLLLTPVCPTKSGYILLLIPSTLVSSTRTINVREPTLNPSPTEFHTHAQISYHVLIVKRIEPRRRPHTYIAACEERVELEKNIKFPRATYLIGFYDLTIREEHLKRSSRTVTTYVQRHGTGKGDNVYKL